MRDDMPPSRLLAAQCTDVWYDLKFRLSAVTSSCERSKETSASLSRGEVSQEAEKVLSCQEGK